MRISKMTKSKKTY